MEETPEKNKTMSVLKWEHFLSLSKLIYHVAALLKIKIQLAIMETKANGLY